jgi:hypothetical protein
MSLDFQQVHEQVRQLGENAPQRQKKLQAAREQALQLLNRYANDLADLRAKVARAAHLDTNLRCALPAEESLTTHIPAPALPAQLTLLAADGSQINPDHHEPVQYCLINVGVIQMQYGTSNPPCPTIQSKLLYDEDIYTSSGATITEALVALRRDLAERKALADLAAHAEKPIITFTDGPVELWGVKDENNQEYENSLKDYLAALTRLKELGAINAGYVDKPGADWVVRLLEVAATPEDDLARIRDHRPFHGITDLDLLIDLLAPGERSAVFAMQSKSAERYRDALALHFFYLNVGRQAAPWLARVEIPAWVAENHSQLNALHAVLIDQCRTMGAQAYPYLLHRAHETAVVSLDEKEQLTQMILLELQRRGVTVGSLSHKQAAKNLAGRSRHRPV